MKTESIRSPKNKYSCTITFKKNIEGIGQTVTVTDNTIEDLEHLAEKYRKYDCHICIKENNKEYPKFEWVTIKEYDLTTNK